FLLLIGQPQHGEQGVGSTPKADGLIDGMNLVVVVIIGFKVLFGFLADGHCPFNAGNCRRQLCARDDTTLGKLVAFEILAGCPQNWERMFAEHQDFCRRLGMKNDKHVRNSHNGYIPTLPEAATTAKTQNGSPCHLPSASLACPWSRSDPFTYVPACKEQACPLHRAKCGPPASRPCGRQPSNFSPSSQPLSCRLGPVQRLPPARRRLLPSRPAASALLPRWAHPVPQVAWRPPEAPNRCRGWRWATLCILPQETSTSLKSTFPQTHLLPGWSWSAITTGSPPRRVYWAAIGHSPTTPSCAGRVGSGG